jgi:hypothetical protein
MKSALSLKELEHELGVGRHTARRLAEEIGPVYAGRRILIPRARLEAWLRGVEDEWPALEGGPVATELTGGNSESFARAGKSVNPR